LCALMLLDVLAQDPPAQVASVRALLKRDAQAEVAHPVRTSHRKGQGCVLRSGNGNTLADGARGKEAPAGRALAAVLAPRYS